MSTTIRMPQLGETVTEGTVAQWLKKVGDAVEKYEAFVEVSTDKVNAEVPAPVSGTIRELIVKEGETVPTGAPIAIIDEDGPHEQSALSTEAGTPRNKSNGESLRGISPAVRRLAREHRVDIHAITGTGANGRVTANDVLAAARVEPNAARGTTNTAPPGSYANPIPGQTIELSQARKIIAKRMVESKHTAPHAWTVVEADVSQLVAWRASRKAEFEREHGVPLTLLPFFLHAVAAALANYPLMNSRFTDAGIEVYKEINLGIAVGLDGNLLVPVIKDAGGSSIRHLAVKAGGLIDRARRGRLGPDDLNGGTFTVNNTGANGSIMSAPIINGGQAGIITMEAAVKRPVIRNDAIAIRTIMNVCLSLDHRVVDGVVASGFLAEVRRNLEAMGPQGTL